MKTKSFGLMAPLVATLVLGFSFPHLAHAAKKASASKQPSKPASKPVSKPASTPAPSPAPEEVEPETAITDDGNSEGDSADAVDQPLRRAVIESAPAPGSETAPIVMAPVATTPPAPSVPSKNEAKEEAVSAETPKPSPTPVSPTPENSVTAEQSLKWLTNGNARFTEKNFRGDGRSAQDRAAAMKQQKPHAVILSCSESVAPPEIIFDQGIGEITTVRVAGPALDASVIRSLEIAVEKYDSRLLIVLGHTLCSAIDESPYVKDGGKDPSRNLEVEAALNADGIARALTERSSILKSRVDSGKLTIKSGLYWIDTGKVKFY